MQKQMYFFTWQAELPLNYNKYACYGLPAPPMTAALKMQTSAHSGVIFEPLKLVQVF